MRVFARFDSEGICRGSVVTYDPSLKLDSNYEEVFNEKEQQLVQSGQCKKILTEQGERIIVIL